MAGGAVLRDAAQEQATLVLNRGYAKGRLENAIGIRDVHVSGLTGECSVGTSGIIYAMQREKGGVISARSAPMLVFQVLGGDTVRTPWVHQEPQPFMRPALDQSEARVRAAIMSAVRKEVLAKGGI
jgi:hypothetical protein